MTSNSSSLGLLLLRLVLGAIFIAHGAQKVVEGIGGTAEGFAGMGIPVADIAAPALAGLEIVGGALLVVGALTRVAAGLLAAAMLVATLLVHAPNGFFAQTGGIEFTLLLTVASAALVFTGPGRFALDAVVVARRPARAGLRPARA